MLTHVLGIYGCSLCATYIRSHLPTASAVSVQAVEQGPFTPVQTTPQKNITLQRVE